MRFNARLFWLLAVIYLIASAAYTVWVMQEPYATDIQSGIGGFKFEIIGTAALAMLSIMSAFIAFYLGKTAKNQGPVPEDNPTAKISDGEAEVGFFNAWSWWPFFLGLFAAFVFASFAVGWWPFFLGLFAAFVFASFAVGWWLFIIGLPLALVALIGFVFENYRGQYAH